MKVIFFRWTKASAIQIIASVKHELQPEYYMTFDNNNKLSEHHSMSYFILRNERWAFFRFDLTLFDICAQFMPNSMKLNQLFVVPVDHFNQIWISTWLKLTLSDNKICLPVNAHENERRKKKHELQICITESSLNVYQIAEKWPFDEEYVEKSTMKMESHLV